MFLGAPAAAFGFAQRLTYPAAVRPWGQRSYPLLSCEHDSLHHHPSGGDTRAIIGAATLQKWWLNLDFEADEVIIDPRVTHLRLL